jgi:hypothetical protein
VKAEKQYYPAIFAGNFESTQAALASLGIVEDRSEVYEPCALGRECPVVFEIVIADRTGQSAMKSAIALTEREDGSIGLWFAMFNHLRSTPDEAIAALTDELLATDPQDAPTVDVFEWSQPIRTLQ